MNLIPLALVVALVVQVSCQLIKFAVNSVQSKTLAWSSLATFGGMPSAHSAFVTSLAASVGLLAGFASNEFAIAVVFSAIVIFDAYKLRGNVEKQARVVNRLQELHLPAEQRTAISEHVGHTLPEILAGILWALIVAVPLVLWLRSLM